MSNDSTHSHDGSCCLSDLSDRDKIWDIRKNQSLEVANRFTEANLNPYADRMRDCALQLVFALEGKTADEMIFRLKSARFCRVRLCPICQWRRSLMWYGRMCKALPLIYQDYPNYRYLFLTLTTKNCEIEELRKTIVWINKAWQKLTQRKQWPAVGFIKSVEITKGAGDTAHPHIHAILLVPPSYFSHGYIKHSEWCSLWQSCLKVDYLPIVNIQVIKPKKYEYNPVQATLGGIREVLKYSVKPTDLIDCSEDWLYKLVYELKGTRAVSLGGVFKNYMSDQEPENLVNENHDEDASTDNYASFSWRERLQRYVS